MKAVTVTQFFKQFPSDDVCLEHLFNVRYGQGHTCSRCGKPSKWYRIQAEKAFSCKCGNHIHPMAGTIFEDSTTPLQSWFYAIYLFTITRNGVSAKELQRTLGVTYKTAWRMGHKIREHMATVDGDAMLSGMVQVDETYIGGKESNKHWNKRQEGMQGGKGKAIVLAMVEKKGEAVTEVIENRQADTLLPHIQDHIEQGSEIHTDEHRGYRVLSRKDSGYKHLSVNHGQDEYVGDSGQTTNSAEGFFSQLKRTINGTHIHVSEKHLVKYAKETEYRFNRRHSPARMLPELLSTFPERDAK